MREKASRSMIMCTLTPAQVFGREPLVKSMCAAGMEAVRINTAHLDGVAQLHAMASTLKSICPGLMVLIDTKGPEMRTTSLAADGELMLEEGECVTLRGCDTDIPSYPGAIYVNYPDIHTETVPGDDILIDDGRIRLRVEVVEGDVVKAVVATGGALGSKKGLAVSGKDMALPAVSRHDREYIGMAAEWECVDVVAHSFVRSASDVEAVRAAMGAATKPIIAKIENRQGLDNLESITAVADGVLIARGDLTASLGAAAVPAAQQKIALAAKASSLPLYLATNILPSLMHGTEVSGRDIEGVDAALRQGVDVFLLTNETASGANPLLSVAVLRELIDRHSS